MRPYNHKFTTPRNSPVASVAATAKIYQPCSSNSVNVPAAYVSSSRSFSPPISAAITHDVNADTVCSSGGNDSGYYASGSFLVAVTPDGQYLYACSLDNNLVRVIRVSDNTVVNPDIAVGVQPLGIAIKPDGKYVYITCFDDGGNPNSISVIDTATYSVTSTINNLNTPFGIAITPNGKQAYFTNLNSDFNIVNIVDTDTNTVVAPAISTGFGLGGIAITPDGKYAYVASTGNNTVNVIEIATNIVKNTISVGNLPAAIAITPDGKFAYIANAGSNSVSIINIATNSVVEHSISVGAVPVAITITPDGKYAYVANLNDNSISVIDIATNNVIATILGISFTGSDFGGVIATPDSAFVYASGSVGLVYKISTATNTVIATI